MGNPIEIAHVTIRQDDQGRYSLNDLFKASGGENRHRPSLWLHLKQTQELILELDREAGIRPNMVLFQQKNKAGIPAYSTTQKSGTFVVKELVYAYAMWISPAFNLKVIRAYDAMMLGESHAYRADLLAIEREVFEKDPMLQQIRWLSAVIGQTAKEICLATGYKSTSTIYRKQDFLVRHRLMIKNPAGFTNRYSLPSWTFRLGLGAGEVRRLAEKRDPSSQLSFW